MGLANVADFAVAPVAHTATKWPSLIESLLAVVAIVALLPSFERVAVRDSGRDARFCDVAIAIGGLPGRVLPTLCTNYGALAEPRVRDRLCRRSGLRPGAAQVDGLPLALVDAVAQTAHAFQRPLAAAETRRAALRLQQREGLGDLQALDNVHRGDRRRDATVHRSLRARPKQRRTAPAAFLRGRSGQGEPGAGPRTQSGTRRRRAGYDAAAARRGARR